MNFTPLFLPRARNELIEAWEWYEDKQTGLGDKFKKEVFAVIDHITAYPAHYPLKKKPYREALIDVFPYVIIYRALSKEKVIVIQSVFHARRNPRNKYK